MTQIWGATSTTDEVLSGIDLHRKRVLVTGVSAGIGVETARTLAAHGAQVTGAVRDLEKSRSRNPAGAKGRRGEWWQLRAGRARSGQSEERPRLRRRTPGARGGFRRGHCQCRSHGDSIWVHHGWPDRYIHALGKRDNTVVIGK